MSSLAAQTTAAGVRSGMPQVATIVGGALAALGSAAVFAWSLLNWDDSSREVVASGGTALGCAIAAIGGVVLVLSLPRILDGLPPWAVRSTLAGLVFVVVDAWYNGTVGVAMANEIDDATFDAIVQSGGQFIFSLPKMLLCLAGFVGLAVAGWRAGTMNRPLATLLGVAAVASLIPPFMPGMLVGGLAFALIAWSRR
jgi:hypothetical protein